MNYEIKISEHKHPVPYVVFEDKAYDLLGEFLLAERSFRREILSVTNDVDLGISEKESFAGNAFTFELTKDTCKITCDTPHMKPRMTETTTSSVSATSRQLIWISGSS